MAATTQIQGVNPNGEAAISYNHPAPWMQALYAPITDDIVYFGINPSTGQGTYVGPDGNVYTGAVADFYRSSYDAKTGAYTANPNGQFINPTNLQDLSEIVTPLSPQAQASFNAQSSASPDYTSPAALAASGLVPGGGNAAGGPSAASSSTVASSATSGDQSTIAALLALIQNDLTPPSASAPNPTSTTGSPSSADLAQQLLQANANTGTAGSGSIAGGIAMPLAQPATTTGPSPLVIIGAILALGAIAYLFLRHKKGAAQSGEPA